MSNLIKDLNSYGVCCGITDKTLGYSFTEHSVPKQFSLTDATCKKSHCINQIFIVTNTAQYLYLLIAINVIIVEKQKHQKK